MTRPLADRDAWRYGLVGAAVALPLVAVLSVQSWTATNRMVDLTPLLLGSAVAGYLQRAGPAGAKRAGIRAAVVGALPLVVVFAGTARWLTTNLLDGGTAPLWVDLLGVVLFGCVVLAAAILVCALGALGGRVGDWLAEKRGRRRTPTRN